MPSVKVITPILGGHYYHLFNRGINRQTIFFRPVNYLYFLRQMSNFLDGYVHFMAYCLLPNHFHFVVKIKDELNIDGKILISEEDIGKVVSNQFRSIFISYSMAINNQENRSGGLFESKFKRLEIEDEEYLKYAIFYTHFNPQKHGIESDFRKYEHSSYHSILSSKATKIDRDLVLEIFGGKQEFVSYHQFFWDEKDAIVIE